MRPETRSYTHIWVLAGILLISRPLSAHGHPGSSPGPMPVSPVAVHGVKVRRWANPATVTRSASRELAGLADTTGWLVPWRPSTAQWPSAESSGAAITPRPILATGVPRRWGSSGAYQQLRC